MEGRGGSIKNRKEEEKKGERERGRMEWGKGGNDLSIIDSSLFMETDFLYITSQMCTQHIINILMHKYIHTHTQTQTPTHGHRESHTFYNMDICYFNKP